MESGPAKRRRQGGLLTLALVAQALLAPRGFGVESIKPTLAVQDLRVVVSYVSTGEIVKLQARFGAHVDLRELRQDYRHGFSILKTHRETGARTCEIYLPNDGRPLKVDDAGTLSLGHELLHCMLGDYHR
jgi:hypothetical protein